jgi:cytochrome c oxidase assembly protein subunit 16
MPAFQSKTFRRAATESSSLSERIGALYRARLARHPFILFGLPFITVIVAGSFALTPAAALRYERYDRKVKQLSQEEAFDLGLKGPDGEAGIKRNPRRRIVGDEKEEYYVCNLKCDSLQPHELNADCIYRDSWPKTSISGSRSE